MSYITEEDLRAIMRDVLPHVHQWIRRARYDFPKPFRGVVAHCLAAVAIAKVGNFRPLEVMQMTIDFTADAVEAASENH
jgi:hypothetical protein